VSAAGGGSAGGGEGSGGARGGGDRGAAADGEVLGAQRTVRDGRRDSMAIEAAAQGGSDALLTAGIAGAVLAVGLLVGFGLPGCCEASKGGLIRPHSRARTAAAGFA
jgi:hypothetical protein